MRISDWSSDVCSSDLCVERLHAHSPAMRIVVLTGYASIATAVAAIKLGASHYLVKPSNTDDIEPAFDKGEGDAGAPLVTPTPAIQTPEWTRTDSDDSPAGEERVRPCRYRWLVIT